MTLLDVSGNDSPLHRRVCIGHADWESQNIRWADRDPLVVHDWDSVIAQPETAIVGLAAAVWPADGRPDQTASAARRRRYVEEKPQGICRYRARIRAWPLSWPLPLALGRRTVTHEKISSCPQISVGWGCRMQEYQ